MLLATELGKVLRDERLKQGLTQADVAKRMGCAVTFVQSIEYGKTSRRTDTYERYALALGKEIVMSLEKLGHSRNEQIQAGRDSLGGPS